MFTKFLDWFDKLLHGALWEIATVDLGTGQHKRYTLRQYPYGAGKLSGGGAWFNFPNHTSEDAAKQGEHVTRLWKAYNDKPRSIIASQNLVFQMFCSEAPKFFWKTEVGNTDNTTPSARPVLFNWSQSQFQATDEWWAKNKFDLTMPAPVQVILNSSGLITPLSPFNWTDEDGANGDKDSVTALAFSHALSNLANLGLSFGGGFFAGHGVSTIGGTARFEVRSMSPNPR